MPCKSCKQKRKKEPGRYGARVLTADEANANGYFEKKPLSFAIAGTYRRRDLRAKQ